MPRMRQALALLALLAWPGGARAAPPPAWLTPGPHRILDGQSDDLVTAGRGVAGIIGPAPAAPYAEPARPSAAELRRAVLTARRDAAFGYGRLYGPNIAPDGRRLADDGRIAGEEFLAYADAGPSARVALLLQVPRQMGPRACLLAIPVNGSASLYRDVADFGFWGLRRGCATVYTDKGAGNGLHDLAGGTVNRLDGTAAPLAEAGADAHFVAPLEAGARARFLADWPHRLAFKHAHGRANPEAGWGQDVLRAIDYAFWQLNERAGEARFTRANTLVIVAGNSNGAGAALAAGEADGAGLIDGIVAAQPQVQTRPEPRAIVSHAGYDWRDPGRDVLDYLTFGLLYMPCAALALPAETPARGFALPRAPARCASLREKGLLSAETLPGQARESLDRLHAHGFDAAFDWLLPTNDAVAPLATAAKYANAYGRFGVEDRLCGLSFAALDAEHRPAPLPAEARAQSFALAPGGAPFGPVDLVNDRDPRGPRRSSASLSASTGRQDGDLDGALCLRALAVGEGPLARRVQAGAEEVLLGGDLRGKPTIILHGRLDGRVPAAFTSRPYLALNSLAEGSRSRLRYLEIAHAEHFGFSGPGYDTRLVPLTPYMLRALDALWAHLTEGAPLPESQVVRTIPRGGEPGRAPPLAAANIPPAPPHPAEADRIGAEAGRVYVPE